MSNLKNKVTPQRIITALTLWVLLMALNVTGVLWTFYRGVTSFTSPWSNYTLDSNYGYGWGYDDVTNTFGYWYGYWATQVSNSWGWSGSSSTWGGGWGGSSTATCTDAKLVCKDAGNGVYKLYRKSGVSCRNGNLGKTCEPTVVVTETPTETPVTPTETPAVVTNTGTCNFPNVNVSYTDTAWNWAISYINDLSNKGIMNGNTSGLLNPVWVFEPWRETTRTEFLKIALRAYCYEYINENTASLTFADVDKNDWKAKVIKKWVDLGIVTAANTNFRPNDSISRAEAIKMLLRVAQTRNTVYTVDTSVTTSSFNDLSATWQAKYVEKAKALAIIANNPSFEPDRGIKRDETSKVVFKSRLFHY